MHQKIVDRLASIQAIISHALENSQKAGSAVSIIAVSKLQTIKTIEAAYHSGIRNFGENYAQELAAKTATCSQDITWHFIGPIQSNKVQLIAENAQWVHSLERSKIARLLNQACSKLNKKIFVLIQVNIDNEDSKSGIPADGVLNFAHEIQEQYPSLVLSGLMFMPNILASEEERLNTFKKIEALRDSFLAAYPQCQELSLGTSKDFEPAIEFGSTMIRVGEILLGARS